MMVGTYADNYELSYCVVKVLFVLFVVHLLFTMAFACKASHGHVAIL